MAIYLREVVKFATLFWIASGTSRQLQPKFSPRKSQIGSLYFRLCISCNMITNIGAFSINERERKGKLHGFKSIVCNLYMVFSCQHGSVQRTQTSLRSRDRSTNPRMMTGASGKSPPKFKGNGRKPAYPFTVFVALDMPCHECAQPLSVVSGKQRVIGEQTFMI